MRSETERALLRFFRPFERRMIRRLRRYLERATGYVVLRARGRRTVLPHEVLLPCARIGDDVVVISTYGRRSDWIRNLSRYPSVEITCSGRTVRGRAEIVEDPERREALVTSDPFFLPVPFALIYGVLWTILRPLFAALIRRWAAARPIVVIHPEQGKTTDQPS